MSTSKITPRTGTSFAIQGCDLTVLICSRYTDQNGQPQGFLRQQNGAITNIVIPNATSSTPWAINPAGDTVGVWVGAAGTHSFLRAPNGAITDIDIPGATFTQPVGINEAHAIAGYYGNAQGTHGFIRT